MEVVGVEVQDQLPDPQTVLRQSIAKFRELKAKREKWRNQSIKFHEWPIGIVFTADQHLGNEGTNYERAFSEAERFSKIENLYQIQLGDLVDNFIVSKLLQKRMGTTVTISQEWALAKYYLEMIQTRWLAMVGGNHEYWTNMAAGFDQLRSIAAMVKPTLLYHPHELALKVQLIGAKNKPIFEVPCRFRHKWRGNSIHNPTHAIERAFERDQGIPFTLGVGAHTHVSALVRHFNAGGKQGMAVICGAYKEIDDFAMQIAAPVPNGSTAVIVVFDENGMHGYNNIEAGIKHLNR